MLPNRSASKLLFALSVSVCLASCGGGGGGTGAGSGSGIAETLSVGSAKVTFSGKAIPAISTSSYGVTVQGLSGTAFNFIDFYPQPSLLNTMLLFQRDDVLWTYSMFTGQSQQISHYNLGSGIVGPGYGTWGPNGLILLSANGTLYQMYADGSHLTPLTKTGVVSNQTISWDGTRIAGLDAGGNLVVMSANGTGIKQLVSAGTLTPSEFSCTWLGNATIAYLDSSYSILTIPASGGSSTSLDASFMNGGDILSGFSDTTSAIMASAVGQYTDVLNVPSAGFAHVLTPSDDYDSDVSVSPDNNTVAIYRKHSSGTTNDGFSGIWTMSDSGENPRLILPDPSGDQILGVASNIQWSNYPTYRRFVGTGGSVATASAGFLTSEVGSAISSFFTFTAKTPSTATITPETSTGAEAPLVFSIHADSISEIWYKNGYYMPATAIPLSGATDAVVSFDNQYGQISFVAPALATRAVESKPKIVTTGSTTECSGQFAAIYDKSGKNLSSGPVTKILVDKKTGKLLSWK